MENYLLTITRANCKYLKMFFNISSFVYWQNQIRDISESYVLLFKYGLFGLGITSIVDKTVCVYTYTWVDCSEHLHFHIHFIISVYTDFCWSFDWDCIWIWGKVIVWKYCFPACELGVCLHLCSLSIAFLFLVYRLCSSFVKFIPKYFIFSTDSALNRTV